MFRDRGQRREIVFVNCEGLVKNPEFIEEMKEIMNTLENAYDYPVDIEYTVFTASSKAAKRSSRVPLFTQNTDSYFPAKALP